MADPLPRATPIRCAGLEWPTRRSLPLERGGTNWNVDLAATLTRRRSVQPSAPISLSLLGTLLWHVCRTLSTAPSPYGFELERRPTPSAGAIHPIHVIVEVPGGNALARYNARLHRLDVLDAPSDILGGLRDRVIELVGACSGTLLACAAEPSRTGTKYENPQSLIWRDTGVLQGILATVAEALEIDFCLLGASGDPWVGLLAGKGQLEGVGLAVLGRRRV